jgi:hypothetical protein
MFITILALILEGVTTTDIVYVVISLASALVVWKSGLLQQLTTSSSELLKLRTTERDDALRERDIWKDKYKELDEEYRVTRRELSQRIELNLEDKEELKELRRLARLVAKE